MLVGAGDLSHGQRSTHYTAMQLMMHLWAQGHDLRLCAAALVEACKGTQGEVLAS